MYIPTPRRVLFDRVLLITLFLHMCIFPQAWAIQNGKQKITIIEDNVTVESVMRQIERQTGLRFMYATGAIDGSRKLKVNFRQIALDEVLGILFNDKGIIWQYRDGVISLRTQRADDSKVGLPEKQSKMLKSQPISGKVLDNSGQPIPGVTIMIKGTTKGTKTDNMGQFSFSDVDFGVTLVVTSIGFEKKEVRISTNNQIIINLNSSTGNLDEVVIAYGKMKRRDLIGNVTTIKADEIAKSPVSNPLLALQGRVTGIFINQNTGFSGGGITTLIQGQNSITKGNDPFYVIDGVPYSSQFLPNLGTFLGNSGTNLGNSGNPLSLINPSDIESISVLKDADATSIYGSRAANGAIIITTKRGKSGEMRTDFNLQQGWQKVSKMLDVLNTKQYLEMRHEAINNDGLTVSGTDYDINGFWDTTRNTNWQKELIGKTANYTNLNASVSGGIGMTSYLFGATYHKESTVFPDKFNDQKGGVHFNINSTSTNQKFRMQLSSSYLYDNNQLPNSDLTAIAIALPPTAPALYNSDGTLNWKPDASGMTTFYNPLSYFYSTYSNKASNIVSNAVFDYNILSNLKLSSSFGFNKVHTDELIKIPLLSIEPSLRPVSSRRAALGANDITSWIIEPQLNYNLSNKNNRFDFLVGASIQQTSGNGYQISTKGYSSDYSIGDIKSATGIIPLGNTELKYKYFAVFGRLNYKLFDKYLANFSIRRDGTSRFGSANRFHNFGSIGLGWIFTEEKIIKNSLSVLSFGKIRINYGTTGNDQIGDYQYLSLYDPISAGIPYRGYNGLIPAGIPNEYLKWEETKKLSFGFDLGFWDDRVVVNMTRNVNRSSNQLMTKPLAWITGVSNLMINFPATVQNTGWEATVSSKNIKSKNFSWGTNFNLTIPRNKLIAYPGLEASSDAGYLFIGKSISTIPVYHSLGVDPTTGEYIFANSKGQQTSQPSFFEDKNILIDASPRYYGGFENSFKYKSIELTFLFQFVKRQGMSYSLGNYPGMYGVNQPVQVMNRWRKEGDNVKVQKFSSDYSIASLLGYANSSDLAYGDLSYIRLKNVSLSWQLPEEIKSKIHTRDFRMSLQAQNLLTFTKYVGGDPEVGSPYVLPALRSIVFGLQVGF